MSTSALRLAVDRVPASRRFASTVNALMLPLPFAYTLTGGTSGNSASAGRVAAGISSVRSQWTVSMIPATVPVNVACGASLRASTASTSSGPSMRTFRRSGLSRPVLSGSSRICSAVPIA